MIEQFLLRAFREQADFFSNCPTYFGSKQICWKFGQESCARIERHTRDIYKTHLGVGEFTTLLH